MIYLFQLSLVTDACIALLVCILVSYTPINISYHQVRPWLPVWHPHSYTVLDVLSWWPKIVRIIRGLPSSLAQTRNSKFICGVYKLFALC